MAERIRVTSLIGGTTGRKGACEANSPMSWRWLQNIADPGTGDRVGDGSILQQGRPAMSIPIAWPQVVDFVGAEPVATNHSPTAWAPGLIPQWRCTIHALFAFTQQPVALAG